MDGAPYVPGTDPIPVGNNIRVPIVGTVCCRQDARGQTDRLDNRFPILASRIDHDSSINQPSPGQKCSIVVIDALEKRPEDLGESILSGQKFLEAFLCESLRDVDENSLSVGEQILATKRMRGLEFRDKNVVDLAKVLE